MTAMTVADLQSLAKDIVSKARSIFILTHSERFTERYDSITTDVERMKVHRFINDVDLGGLKNWIRSVDRGFDIEKIGIYKVRKLRDIAKWLGIRGYQSMTKEILLSEIRKTYDRGNNQTSRRDERIDP